MKLNISQTRAKKKKGQIIPQGIEGQVVLLLTGYLCIPALPDARGRLPVNLRALSELRLPYLSTSIF